MSFSTLGLELGFDAVEERQRDHVHDVASEQRRVNTSEHASSATFVFELVVSFHHGQWAVAQICLLSRFDSILRDRNDPTKHACHTSGI